MQDDSEANGVSPRDVFDRANILLKELGDAVEQKEAGEVGINIDSFETRFNQILDLLVSFKSGREGSDYPRASRVVVDCQRKIEVLKRDP